MKQKKTWRIKCVAAEHVDELLVNATPTRFQSSATMYV